MKTLVGVAGLFLAMLASSCVPAAAKTPEVGDTTLVQAVCETKDFPELFVRMATLSGSYAEGIQLLQEKVEEGECVILPQPVMAVIEEVGEQSIPFVDTDGDVVEARAVRVSRVWTVSVKFVEGAKGGRS